ncbi:hypothetical protein FOZG_17466 [Fusarium oxysporum Fo47]|uniref:Uncharacterized protein n=1 Tax=Fusarium oxysporum Fo47 TaxID=660027 RepID=W9JAN0_FUSOX|nr:hypothetical protein FOZG_17466 [Fusarium oxysporum Fo47]
MGSTALFAAVANGHLHVAKLLITSGAAVEMQGSVGQSLIWWAFRAGNTELIQLLVEHGETVGTRIYDDHIPNDLVSPPFDHEAPWCDACLGQSYLGDPSAAPLPKDGCSEHPDLRVYEGYACRKCPLRTTNFSSLTRHISTQYFQGQPPGKRELDEFYDEVWLQAWTAGSNQSRRYWIVSRGGLATRTSDAIQAHLASIKEQERLSNSGKDIPTHTESGGMRTNSQGDLLRFEEQTPWIERTGWDKTYHQG